MSNSSDKPVYKSYKDTPNYRPMKKFEPTAKEPGQRVFTSTGSYFA